MNGSTAPARTALGFIALAFGMLSVTPSDAWAYIDPGTGSYLFQLAAAGLLAGVYTMRHYWYAFTSALRARAVTARSPRPSKRTNDME